MSQSSPVPTAKKSLLSDQQYNLLKHVASIGLPFVAALYAALSQIWNWPDTTEVLLSITGVNTVLGGLLHYSTVAYSTSEAKYAGVLEVLYNEVKPLLSLDLNKLPAELKNMAEATFKVNITTQTTAETPAPTTGEASTPAV